MRTGPGLAVAADWGNHYIAKGAMPLSYEDQGAAPLSPSTYYL